MRLFDNLFGKKQPTNNEDNSIENEISKIKPGTILISTGSDKAYEVIKQLTEEQKEQIEKSTFLLRNGQLYMHYWTDNLVDTDRDDPLWQNQVMFFWKAEEPFPKKSLPPEFETFKTKYFLFSGDTSKISLRTAQAIPWFGMPGLGSKHVCELNEKKITIPELKKLELVEYVEPVELTDDNFGILTDKANFFFFIDERITPFHHGNFYLEGKPIPIHLAYSIGGIQIMKRVN
jgi:hypothetical protein